MLRRPTPVATPAPLIVQTPGDAEAGPGLSDPRRRSNPNSSRLDRHDRARCERFAVKGDHVRAGGSLITGSETDNPNDTGVRSTPHNGELAKVLVERNEDAPMRDGRREDRFVSWILGPLAGPDHVVTCGSQRDSCASPDTRVEQELHVPVFRISGSTRSWPTRRRA